MFFARVNPNTLHSLKTDTRYIVHSQTDFDDATRDVSIVSEISKSFRFLVPSHHLVPETTKPEPRRISPEHAQRQRDLRHDLVVHLIATAVQNNGTMHLHDDTIAGVFLLADEVSRRF